MAEQYSGVQNTGWSGGFDISNVLKSKVQSISQSVSGFTNQTVNPIKSTVSDIKSGIALVKDTDRQFLNQLHSYRSQTIETINNYLGSLTGGAFTLSDFGRVVSFKDGFKVDSDELVRMAGNAMGFNISSVANIGSDLTNQFLNELNDMSLGLSNGLFQVDGGRVTISGDWDKQIGDAVFNFLSNGSDDFRTVRNFAASNAVLNVMVRQNANIGFVEGFSGFKDMYLYESDYHAALIGSIDILLGRGDVNSLNEVLNILNAESIMSVKAIYPKFAETVFTQFKLPDDAYVEDYNTYGEKLITIIQKVCGTEWYLSNTFYGKIMNIGLVSKASESSITVIEHYSQTLANNAAQLRKESKDDEAAVLEALSSNLVLIIACAGFVTIDSATNIFRHDFPAAVTF